MRKCKHHRKVNNKTELIVVFFLFCPSSDSDIFPASPNAELPVLPSSAWPRRQDAAPPLHLVQHRPDVAGVPRTDTPHPATHLGPAGALRELWRHSPSDPELVSLVHGQNASSARLYTSHPGGGVRAGQLDPGLAGGTGGGDSLPPVHLATPTDQPHLPVCAHWHWLEDQVWPDVTPGQAGRCLSVHPDSEESLSVSGNSPAAHRAVPSVCVGLEGDIQ